MNVAPEETTVASALPALGALFAQSRSPGLRRIGAAVVLGYTGARLVQSTVRTSRDRRAYQVRVPSDDMLYRRVAEWVNEAIPPSDGRSLQVETRRDNGSYESAPISSSQTEKQPFRLLFDGQRNQSIEIAGHRVSVSIERENLGGERRTYFSYQLVFTARSLAGRNAVVEHLRELHAMEVKAPPVLRVADKWGDWCRMTDSPVRPLESVILPAGEREAIEEDLRRFLASESEYFHWGTPWHRGYLFSGPPGTGKTSMASALAFAFGLDVSYLSLTSISDDDTLLRLMRGVPVRSVLIIEDIDVVHASRTRDDSGSGITLAGLLNALDGIVTPHGLITILTTNRREVLDSALTRSGRIDYEWVSRELTAEQAARIGEHYQRNVDGFPIEGQFAADLVSHLKDLDD